MTFWNVLSLLGGLALFLYAIMEMNKHLTAVAGRRMKTIMTKLTDGPFRGYFTGLGITMVNQSSSATTVLEAALVGAGFMTFKQSLTVTLGAELGSTLFPQLVAIPGLTKFSSLFLLIGLIILLSAKKKEFNHLGMILISFGMLFMGMDIMSQALSPLREYEPFIRVMKNAASPLVGIVAGLLFTMLIQSSGATVGITIAMALAGTISLEEAIPINLGAAVGTCITAILGSITLNWEAKRSAYIHVLFQILGVIWVYILLLIRIGDERLYIWLIKWFCLTILGTESLSRQIAMGFTFMPVINHLILFPNLSLAVKLFNRIFPEREKSEAFAVKYIDNRLISRSARLSLEMARKEIIRVTEFLVEMGETLSLSLHNRDNDYTRALGELDGKVDFLNEAIINFLVKLSREEMTEKESAVCLNYIQIQNELESIGDVMDKNIMVLMEKRRVNGLHFSDEGFGELDHLLTKIRKNLDLISLIFREDKSRPSRIKSIRDDFKKKEEEKYKQLHIKRLQEGLSESVATSAIHLDLITYFSRINKQINYIARKLDH
ncbi:MAG: Na/Pi cotransporter family protein [Spirochaetales bacterium]|nr:Na/Pi cotransporter family protein [Spirochaetales bacterium]